MDDPVNIRWPPNVPDAAQDWMVFELFVNDAARAFLAVGAVMTDPGVAQNLLAATARPFLALPVEFGVWALLVARVLEGMSGSANGENRFAGIQIIDEVLHLVVRQFPKAQLHHHQV